METTEKLNAPNITITIYPPQVGEIVTVDMLTYLDELCCFEVIAVKSTDDKKQDGMYINTDKTGFSYTPDLANGYWQAIDNYDVIEYCIRDINTDETAVGNVIIQVVERGLFDALDVCFNFKYNSFKQEIEESNFGSLDLSLVNKFENVQVEQIGDYNAKLIKSITIDPDNPAKLIVYGNKQCNNWHPGTRTEVEYAISALVDGETSTSKAKIIFTCTDSLFFAEGAHVTLNEPLPAYVDINVKDYNPLFAQFTVDSVGSTTADRGSISIVSPTVVRYTFNLGSGYWTGGLIEDVFRYTAYNSTSGKTACNYIRITKNPPASGIGSGSGSGSGGGTTLYFSPTISNAIYLTGITTTAAGWDADLGTMYGVQFIGVPGTHNITGGRVRIALVSMSVYKITFIAGGTPMLNSIAPIYSMKLFVSGSSPTPSWIASILSEDPGTPSEDSFITIA